MAHALVWGEAQAPSLERQAGMYAVSTHAEQVDTVWAVDVSILYEYSTSQFWRLTVPCNVGEMEGPRWHKTPGARVLVVPAETVGLFGR